ncbi:MAG: hypothetical protein FJZ58_05830 [Chlamydiae bacterium]|nr:hypothetical protein [Chlamydiota bacterium]
MGLFAQVPLVVSFYTKKTLYEEAGEALIASCVKFGIEYDIEAVETLGSWEENCSRKPGFLVQKMQEHARPLLWVDADALFLRPLVFEEFMFYDMAIMRYQEEDPRFAVGAGTVYINATQKGRKPLFFGTIMRGASMKLRAMPFLS